MLKLFLSDCLEKLRDIPDNSIDAIVTDPPYGTTDAEWDNTIDFNALWPEIWRVLKKKKKCSMPNVWN